MRQGDDKLSRISFSSQVVNQLLGYVPRQKQGIFRLIFEKDGFLHDGYQRARQVVADFVRAFHLQNIIYDSVVETHIVHKRACPGRSADTIDPVALLFYAEEKALQLELREGYTVSEIEQVLFARDHRGFFAEERAYRFPYVVRPRSRGVDAHRAAVGGNLPRMYDLKAVSVQQVFQTMKGVIPEMFMIDSIILECLDQG